MATAKLARKNVVVDFICGVGTGVRETKVTVPTDMLTVVEIAAVVVVVMEGCVGTYFYSYCREEGNTEE